MDEDLILRTEDGRIVFEFDTPEMKRQFEGSLVEMARKADRNRGEGYRCGQCAAYPCFRTLSSQLSKDPITPQSIKKQLEKTAEQEAMQNAGLCFQATRRCRQECPQYRHDGSPAHGGICKVNEEKVGYEQDCHIPEMRSKVK